MLILGHLQNNKMNSMTTFAWCKRDTCYVIVHVCLQLFIVHLVYPIVQMGVKSDQAIHMLSSGFNMASISICI